MATVPSGCRTTPRPERSGGNQIWRLHPSAPAPSSGGIFSLALVMAPLGLALATTPSGAAAPHAVTPHAARPFLAQQPHTFPPASTTFTVNTTNDTDDATPGNGTCADAASHCSLRAAIEEANALSQTVTVNVPPGTYTTTLGALEVTDAAGVQILGTGAGVSITNAGASSDIFETQHAAASGETGAFLDLTNVTVTGSGSYAVDVNDINDVVTATNTTFSNNAIQTLREAPSSSRASSGPPTRCSRATRPPKRVARSTSRTARSDSTRDTFTSNTATSNSTFSEGGAIYNSDGPVAVDNTTFTGNSATTGPSGDGSGGGAIGADDAMSYQRHLHQQRRHGRRIRPRWFRWCDRGRLRAEHDHELHLQRQQRQRRRQW